MSLNQRVIAEFSTCTPSAPQLRDLSIQTFRPVLTSGLLIIAAHGGALVAANRDEGAALASAFRFLAKPALRSSCLQLRNSFEI